MGNLEGKVALHKIVKRFYNPNLLCENVPFPKNSSISHRNKRQGIDIDTILEAILYP